VAGTKSTAETPAPEAGAPLNFDAIAALDDRKTETVDVPEWGGTVTLAALNGAERFDLIQRTEAYDEEFGQMALPKLNYLIVAMTLLGPDGQRAPDPIALAEALEDRDFDVIQRLYRIAVRLSGLGDQETEARAEALAGEAEPSGDSSTD
jgi:hypothetical protein